MSKRHIVFCIILIASISLCLKLYTVDFSYPVNSDNLGYALMAISYKNGDFSQLAHRGSGWPLLLYPFFSAIHSDNFLDYSNLERLLSIAIATISIPTVYLLGRKFFNEKYSLVMASLFAFEPHLNQNSGLGLTEPLSNLIVILMMYFILNKDAKYVIPSLILAGIGWWVRINGFSMLIVISVIYFISFRNNPKLFRNYILGITVFLMVISPMLVQRYDQYGDPFYFWYGQHIFSGNYEMSFSENTQNVNPSAFDYINKNGIGSFIDNFILRGVYNIIYTLAQMSVPYLFILLPFGVLFSLRAFDQNTKYIKSNWIFIVVSLSTMLITMSVYPDKRYLYYIFPFLIIIGTIPIQRLIEYGLSTFSFSSKQKNICLIVVVLIVLVLSSLYAIKYGKPDSVFENEKNMFAEFLVQKLDGKVLSAPMPAFDYVPYVLINNPPGNFKNYRIHEYEQKNSDQNKKFDTINLYATSIQELVQVGETYDLKYIVSNEKEGIFHPYVNEIYHNEEKYPYLHKIFDSNEAGFTKLKVKVFEINYKKFHEND